MSPGAKIGGFLAGLVLVGLIGAGIGAWAGPIDTAPTGHGDTGHDAGPEGASHPDDGEPPAGDGHDGHGTEPEDPADDGHGAHGAAPGMSVAAPGTTATQDGYTLVLEPTAEEEVRFRITDPAGDPVTATEIVHEKPLHLILVGHVQGDYAHLHPEVAPDGTWSAAVSDVPPGPYRAVADLRPVGGPALVLADDLAVPGEVGTRGGVPAEGNPTTVDGITVTFEGHPEVGDTDLAFTATRDGEVIEPEPYLGARGHLVAFRAGDLAYSHVHPHDGAEGPVRFTATFPSAERYALYLDLRVDGVVRTFVFMVEVHGHDS